MKLFLIPMIVLGVAGCSAVDKSEQADSGYRCVNVKVTGSNLPRRECTTRAQREEREKQSQDWMKNRTHQGNQAGSKVRQ